MKERREDNTQMLPSFIVSNVSAYFGVILSEKVEYNTSLKISHSQSDRNAVINMLKQYQVHKH